ncbi:MAG: hypothetical protein ACRC0Y_14400 [Fusobacteriaceae bacterium]
MKKLLLVAATLLLATAAFGAKYQDGTYRGIFLDGGEQQVGVQFDLKEDVVTKAAYRTLAYKNMDYLKDENLKPITDEHKALLEYAVGKNVDEAMKAMYTPENIEKAGATIRATKVRAAFKNGLIHDVYKPMKNN